RDQDPITWLEDIDKAFEANLISSLQKIFVIILMLKGLATIW
ncbi:2670_t:CDS:1, partial [Racocetra persica]